jgi:hypothetical protein
MGGGVVFGARAQLPPPAPYLLRIRQRALAKRGTTRRGCAVANYHSGKWVLGTLPDAGVPHHEQVGASAALAPTCPYLLLDSVAAATLGPSFTRLKLFTIMVL